jgi:hypothetical protein
MVSKEAYLKNPFLLQGYYRFFRALRTPKTDNLHLEHVEFESGLSSQIIIKNK